MIRYQLQCRNAHSFEAWFNNSAAYDAQLAAGNISCPFCRSKDVSKSVMAPNVSPRTRIKSAAPPPPPSSQATAPLPARAGGGGGDDKNTAPAAPVAASSSRDGRAAAGATSDSFAMHRELTEVMRKIRREVEKTAEYVGPHFAEEARKIHDEESEPRGIYGEATAEEVAELNDEGIEFLPLPRLPEDNN